MIREIGCNEIEIVRELAHEIWPITFKDILSSKQIEYMLNWMYSKEKLEYQLVNGHQFFVVSMDDKDVGFLGIEQKYQGSKALRIHKIYVQPQIHGKGLGKQLMLFAKELAIENDLTSLHLNVNRYNNAVDFYKHLGFEIIQTEDIDIGNNYLMEDYVMEWRF